MRPVFREFLACPPLLVQEGDDRCSQDHAVVAGCSGSMVREYGQKAFDQNPLALDIESPQPVKVQPSGGRVAESAYLNAVGHTGNIWSIEQNRKLPTDRAEVEGTLGPVASIRTEEAKGNNRRVDPVEHRGTE